MAVKYKKNGTWYDISSSSNNAVDAVENGNMNPVTSNAVAKVFAKRYETINSYITPCSTIKALDTTASTGYRLSKLDKDSYRLHLEPARFTAKKEGDYIDVFDISNALTQLFNDNRKPMCTTENCMLIYDETKGTDYPASVYISLGRTIFSIRKVLNVNIIQDHVYSLIGDLEIYMT